MSRSNGPPTLPTLSVLGYMLTVWAWLLEIVILLLHIFTDKKFDPLGHSALLGVSLLLTAFAAVRGRRDLQTAASIRGPIRLSNFQAFLIVVLMVGFSCLMAWIAGRLKPF